jgi:hypothetical protein
MQEDGAARGFEGMGVAGIEVALDRQTLRQDDRMAIQPDMDIGDGGGHDLADGGAVDQVLHRDEHVIHEDGMVGR